MYPQDSGALLPWSGSGSHYTMRMHAGYATHFVVYIASRQNQPFYNSLFDVAVLAVANHVYVHLGQQAGILATGSMRCVCFADVCLLLFHHFASLSC